MTGKKNVNSSRLEGKVGGKNHTCTDGLVHQTHLGADLASSLSGDNLETK